MLKRTDFSILTDLHVLSPPAHKIFFVCQVSVCAPEQLDGFYSYPIIRSICHRLVPHECEHYSPRNRGGGSSDGP
jgi:hypothetical protein